MGLSRPAIDRFAEKIALTDAGCLEWIGHIERHGYARLWVDRRNVSAHRLEPVTPSENVRRGAAAEAAAVRASRITHCPEGHPYSDENTYRNSGSRVCLACKKQRAKDDYQRNREVVIERARLWRLANLERSRELSREGQRRYRAKKKAA